MSVGNPHVVSLLNAINRANKCKKAHKDSLEYYKTLRIERNRLLVYLKEGKTAQIRSMMGTRIANLEETMSSSRNHSLNVLKEYMEYQEYIERLELEFGLKSEDYRLTAITQNALENGPIKMAIIPSHSETGKPRLPGLHALQYVANPAANMGFMDAMRFVDDTDF